MRSMLPVSLVGALGLLSPGLCSGTDDGPSGSSSYGGGYGGSGYGSPTNLTDWEQIHQVINLYSLAVDFNGYYTLFPQVFAQDAFANYTGANSNLHGLANITAALAPDANLFTAQHSVGTTYIDIKNATYANATWYDIATIFGKGSHQGKQVQLYGLYRDTYEKIPTQGWRVKTRYYSQMGPPFGDTSVLSG